MKSGNKYLIPQDSILEIFKKAKFQPFQRISKPYINLEQFLNVRFKKNNWKLCQKDTLHQKNP